MRGLRAVFGKELRTYFTSPIAYVFVAFFLALMAWLFASVLSFYIDQFLRSQQNPYAPGAGDINEFIRIGTFQQVLVVFFFFTPMLTMRLMAGEKKAKTDELLLTSPISTTAIVLGKFLAALAVVGVALATTLYVPIATEQIGSVDWGPVATAYLGLLALAGCFLSMGLFCSTLTEDQIVAAVLAFVAILGLLIVPTLGSLFEAEWVKKTVEYVAYQDHFDRLAKGVVDTRDVVYLLSFMGLFLFLSHQSVAAVQWRTQSAEGRGSYRWVLLVFGVVLILGYFLAALIVPSSGMESEPWRQALWVVGCVAAAGYVAWDWDEIVRRFRTRSFVFSSLASVQVLAVAAIVVGANYLAARRYAKWDVTNVGLYTLAPQSVKVAQTLPGEVELSVFMKDTEPTKEALRELLGLYAESSDNIKVRFVDPDKNPEEAQRYNVDLYNTLVFKRGEQTTRINSTTEQDITSALIKVSREGTRTVCFVTGHGEKDPFSEEVAGYNTARKAVEGQGYETKAVNLTTDGIPQGCSIVVVAGPQKEPLPAEMDRLKEYLSAGGRVLLMIDPLPSPSLGKWLEGYGVVAHDDIVVDRAGIVVGDNYLSTVVTPPYPIHDITKDIPGQMIFPGARTLKPTREMPPGVLASPIVSTREDVWGEVSPIEEGRPEYNEGKDRAGPMDLAFAVSIRAEGEAETEENVPKGARMVVVADSDFANNRYFYLFSFNSDFFLNAVSWLVDDANLVAIRPRTRDTTDVTLPSQAFQQAMFWFPSFVFPGLILAGGVAIWLRRRRS